MIVSQAVLIAIGIDWDGRRQVLAVELANRESRSSWRDFLLGLKARGLHGVEFVVADDHAGLRAALREVLAEAAYQRCYVHFLRNALDYVSVEPCRSISVPRTAGIGAFWSFLKARLNGGSPPQCGYSLAKAGSCASKFPARLRCSSNAAVRARGDTFIRSRPPSCAGSRAFRMGTKMGGIGRCFLMFLE